MAETNFCDTCGQHYIAHNDDGSCVRDISVCVTEICTHDLLHHFGTPGVYFNKPAFEKAAEMTEEELQDLADMMAEDYCEQMFWSSLDIIFRDHFLNKEK